MKKDNMKSPKIWNHAIVDETLIDNEIEIPLQKVKILI